MVEKMLQKEMKPAKNKKKKGKFAISDDEENGSPNDQANKQNQQSNFKYGNYNFAIPTDDLNIKFQDDGAKSKKIDDVYNDKVGDQSDKNEMKDKKAKKKKKGDNEKE